MNKIYFTLQELRKLENLFFETDSWTEDELMNWYIECLGLFEAIGLKENITDKFSMFFNTFLLQEGGESSLFNIVDHPRKYKTKTASIHLLTIKITFSIAKKKLELTQEYEKIIPTFIIKFFETNQSYGHISTALASIDKSISEKNIESMMTSSNTLLDSILDYVADLKGKKLGKKLRLLIQNNADLCRKLGLEPEIIYALNNSRVIRNIELIHPRENIKQSVPYICAITYAYLVILLLKIMLALDYFK